MSRPGDTAGAIDGRVPPSEVSEVRPGPATARPPTEGLLRRLIEIAEKQLAATEKNNELLTALLAVRKAAQASQSTQARPTAAGQRGTGEVASARDLDGEHGDPEVKFNPKDWKGADYKGARFSQTEPAFLELMAEAKDYFADHPKPGKEQYAKNDRRDAARARGWADRIRQGFKAAPRVEPQEEEVMVP